MPRKLTCREFIDRSIKIHEQKYDYSKVEYINNSTKVLIGCNTCDAAFYQTPNCHMLGQGCPACGRRKCDKNRSLTTEQFIQRANIVHSGFYNYSRTKYKHNEEKVNIECPIHGIFSQPAYSHLKGHGCQLCSKSGFSKKALQWIQQIERDESVIIKTALVGGEFIIPTTRYKADGYCEETNTIYEFYGDKWHGNLNIFDEDQQCHPYNNKPARQLYKETMKREQRIRDLGFTVVTIWENEFENQLFK